MGEEEVRALEKKGYVAGGTAVGDACTAVAEIVATGVNILSVASGVNCAETGVALSMAEDSGVNTSTLKVQPETKKQMIRRNALIFFMMSPFDERRFR